MRLWCTALLIASFSSEIIGLSSHENCDCGKMVKLDSVGTRIVGGIVTTPHLYPWMVAILSNGKLHCGGAIINDRYILTAGHCLYWSSIDDLTVIMGMHDRLSVEGITERSIPIQELIVHDDFTSDELHDSDDIGLIKVTEPIVYTESIKPVCLPKPEAIYDGLIGMVTGWGRTAQNGKPSRYLMKAEVKILHLSECKNTTVGEHVNDKTICAYEFNTDACQGDSGGPLVYEKSPGKVEQIGIVSWGIGCARPGIPGVYTKITAYLKWIKENTRDGTYCKHN